jgi:RNA polymerase primary sigma factor
MRGFKIGERYTPSAGKSFRRYLNEVDKCKILRSEQEVDLVKRAQSGDSIARDKLITSNLRFVISVAKSYTSDPDLFPEIVAAGNIGLIDSVEKFDPSKGFKFISYAVWHIRKEILHHLSTNLRTIRIPSHRIGELKAIQDTESKLMCELGRHPTIDEVIETLEKSGDERFKNLELSTLIPLMNADVKPKSLEAKISSDEDVTLSDFLASDGDLPDAEIGREFNRQMILNLLKPLNESERDVVLRHHGFQSSGIPESFPLMSENMGLTAEALRLRYVKAIKKMKIWAKKNKYQVADL